jgi:hypothetical protein
VTPVTDLTAAIRWLTDAQHALTKARERMAAALPVGLYAKQLDDAAEKLLAGAAFLQDELAFRRGRLKYPQ